ncbi:MAG: hypothetical protein IKB01_03375 [Lachnospiraceae bacterium]|nr:hypothetical protein [Lachnospiraceae bacterium]
MPLLSVYNHLLQGYHFLRPTRFDSHKKSELKDVYQRIMRMTAEQPLYKISFDESAQTYTLGIKDAALSLSSTVKELHIDDGTSIFEQKTLASSDPETIEISLLDGSEITEEQLPLEITVASLSSPQENHGYSLPKQDSVLPSGQYTFTIGVEKNLYSFQFNVSAGATNIELQQKLSDFINKTSIGLNTRITLDPENNTSRLDVTSVASGCMTPGSSAFTAQDIRHPKESNIGIVSHFGLDQIARLPENTTFAINGRYFESRAHAYTTEYGLSMKFHSITDTPVMISRVTNQAPVADKVKSFIDGYNSILEIAKQHKTENHRAKKLTFDLHNTLRRYTADLTACGILLEKDGTLSMDREQVYAAARNGSLERFFSSENTFSGTLLNKLSDISLNPMEYLDKTVVTYPNTTAKKTVSPYISSIYSGLLFNNYC